MKLDYTQTVPPIRNENGTWRRLAEEFAASNLPSAKLEDIKIKPSSARGLLITTIRKNHLPVKVVSREPGEIYLVRREGC